MLKKGTPPVLQLAIHPPPAALLSPPPQIPPQLFPFTIALHRHSENLISNTALLTVQFPIQPPPPPLSTLFPPPHIPPQLFPFN